MNITRQIILITTFTLFSYNIKSQVTPIDYVLSNFLNTIKLYESNLSYFITSDLNEFIKYSNVDTTDVAYIDGNKVSLLTIKIALDKNFIAKKRKEENDTLNFTILTYHNKYYKLFGFYHSNISLLYNEIGDETFKKLISKTNLLNKKELKNYIKSLRLKKEVIDSRVNMPSEFLRIYYPNNKKNSSSILLKVEPLVPL